MKSPIRILLLCLTAAMLSPLAQSQYAYYSQNTFTTGSYNMANWQSVATSTATSGIGLTAASSGGALISTQTVPGSSTDYEVEAILTLMAAETAL